MLMVVLTMKVLVVVRIRRAIVRRRLSSLRWSVWTLYWARSLGGPGVGVAIEVWEIGRGVGGAAAACVRVAALVALVIRVSSVGCVGLVGLLLGLTEWVGCEWSWSV